MRLKSLPIACLLWLTALPAAAQTQRLGGPPRPEPTPAERAGQLRQLRELYQRAPAEWPAPTLDPGVEHHELGPLPEVEKPSDLERAKAELGEQLFFDPRLSGSRQIACASCHDPDLGWADGRTTSFGHNRRRLERNAPSILNSRFRETLFWDGRADSLEDQAVAVLSNADEMHSGDEVLVENLESIPDYVRRFGEVFGAHSPGVEQVSEALAAFERTVVGSRTRFDAFVGGRHKAMTDEEISGLHLFRTAGRCMNCHSGPLFTDDKFHAIGLSQYGRPGEDLGRYLVTEEAADVGAFRTPSLRNVARTRPYMHSGLFDLDEVLRLYNAGMPSERDKREAGGSVPPPTKSALIKPLGLNDRDLRDIEAFLGSLTESNRRVRPPELPPGL
ncbi:cytochrome c peroxidase [Botrimarina sp.]|uniref:cytochrome-c peroxidase n=1 Tax=Botrimarina sp. TaxID=2795802 RepID=UPI0032ED19B9